MKFFTSSVAVASILALLSFTPSTRAQTVAFTYQGSLTQTGANANGTFDIQFGIFTNSSTGPALLTITNAAVGVTNSLFTTTLNVSNVFDGSALWLDVAVRTNGSVGSFTELTPRQSLGATPYALFAPSAGTVSGVLAVSNLPTSVALLSGNQVFTGSITATNFVGNGSGLTNLPSTPAANGFLFAFDNSTQTFTAGSNNFQTVTFNNPTNMNGWSLPGAFIGPAYPNFTVSNGGLYLIQYQAQLSGTNGRTVSMRAILNMNNTAEIPGSQSIATLATNGVTSLNHTFMGSLNSGDVLSIQFTTDGAGTVTITNGGTSALIFNKPSASLSVIRVQ